MIDATCPSCTKDTTIRCQSHFAASYSGDATGRFHDREYRLGDTMPWFAPDHAHYGDSSPADEEACYSECTACNAELCVVIRFRAFIPEQILRISREADWPDGYPR